MRGAGLLLLGLVSCAAPPPPPRRVDPSLQVLDRLSWQIEELPPGVRWQTITTPSFRVQYLSRPQDMELDRHTAQRVAEVAEQTRQAQQRRWYGEARPPWDPRCAIQLYPSTAMMVQMSGGDPKAASSAARPSQLRHGQMLQRRVILAADDQRLLDSTLPHEVSHIIVAELLGAPVPLWANEGLAMTNESQLSRMQFEEVLDRFRARGQLFQLPALMRMERYPDGEFNPLFYAQSLSLVRFLLSLNLDPRTARSRLLRLLRAGIDLRRVEQALRQEFGLTGLQDLSRRWLRWLES